MAFVYSDVLREEFLTDGVTILRGLIPASLLTDLRREADKGREIARQVSGAQAQRLQPVYKYPELNHKPFRDFLDLPELRKVVENLLSPEHHSTDIMGILFEPAEKPWCTHWHRDWGYNVPDLDLEAFFDACRNLQMFCQFNGALYDDHSLWAVPGSHNREDTDDERSAFPCIPPPAPDLGSAETNEERETRCQAYVRQMPGAVQIPLFAGDVAFYRACCWHIGVYVPYTRRATLHDNFIGADDVAWQKSIPEMQARVREKQLMDARP